MKINAKKNISPNDQWTADEFNGMPYRRLGNSGLRVANVGIGTWLQLNPSQRRNVILATKIFAPMDGVSPNHSRLALLSEEWHITLNQLVIAYMLAIPGMGPVIPSVSSVSQLESNALGGRITFSREEILEIEEILTEK